MRTYYKVLAVLLVAGTLGSCKNNPKVIDSAATEESTPIFQDAPVAPETEAAEQPEREIVAREILNTDRYTYIRASEGSQEFWVAVAKQDIKVGNTYYFQRALLKQNFPSQEFNRVFETLYLVSDLREQPLGAAMPAEAGGLPQAPASVELTEAIPPTPGATKLSDLFANTSKYNGKKIKVTGKCVKVNPMIMGRNWIHLQDGSGKNLDLTITTMENIPLGAIITLEGTIALNKDFGAGYKYDVIMEGAVFK